MAAKKEEKLDKGFEEVPLNLDEGFEDTADSDKAMADRGINPDSPDAEAQLANMSPSKGPVDTGQRDALARGLGKGVTFGAQAPLAGAGAAAMQAITGNQGPKQGRDLPALMAAYKEMRDQQIDKNAQAQQAFPKTFGAGQLAGSLPTAIATGGAAPSMETMGLQGAGAGLGNYLGSNKDPNAVDAMGATGRGGLIGMAIPAAVGAVSDAAPGIANAGRNALNKFRGVMNQNVDPAAEMSAPEGMQSFGPDQMDNQQPSPGLLSKAKSMLPQNTQEQMNAGAEGIDTNSPEAAQKTLPEEANKSSDYLTKKLLNTQQELINDTTQSLKNATKGGMTIDHASMPAQDLAEDEATTRQLDDYEDPNSDDDSGSDAQKQTELPVFAKAFDDLQGLVDSESSYADAGTEDGKMAQKLFAKITKFKESEEGEQPSSLVDQHGNPLIETGDVPDSDYRTQLNPSETKNLMDDVYKYSKVLSKNDQPELSKIAYNFYKGLRDRLRVEVPEYADAADRLNQFQQYIPETLMADGNTATDAGVRLSESNSKYMDIKDPTQALISNLSKDGTGSYTAKQTYNKLEQALETLEPLEKARQAAAQAEGKPFESVFEKIGMNAEQLLKFLRDKSVRAKAYDQMKTGSIPLNPTSVQKVTGFLREHSDVLANKVGNLMSNAPLDVLYAASEKLAKNPATASLGAGLKTALAGNDLIKRNAAIFAILQNPTAKAIIDPDIKSDDKQQANVPKRSPYNTEF